jgi:probable rRNA maturation factor
LRAPTTNPPGASTRRVSWGGVFHDMVEDGRDILNGGEEESGGLEVALTFSYEPEGLTDDLFGISEEQLLTALELALESVGIDQSVEVSALITTDEGIRELNRDYRGKDESTDVLSFPLLDEPLVEAPADQLWQPAEVEDAEDGAEERETVEDEMGDASDFADGEDEDALEEAEEEADGNEDWPLHLGDIVLARETVIRQAERAGHRAAYEAAYLFVHGALHLIGYDDHTDAGYRAMVAIQEAALARAGITR